MPAILYSKNAYDTGGTRLVGLQAANRHFLDALIRDATVGEVGCYVAEPKAFDEFSAIVAPLKPATKTITHIPFGDHAALERAGALHKSDPTIAPLLWQRRFTDQRLYSVVGVIHSISALHVMESIGDLVVAPFQPWDALICTSQAGKDALTTMLGNWAEYLGQRFNARPQLNITLPLIPLGIDCGVFDAESGTSSSRARVRAELGVGESDIAVLFVGRLTYRRKCHPVPMYLALQKAQEATGARLHFIQAGQFEDPDEEALFQQAAAQFAPDVRTLIVGGRELFRDQGVWSAGDIFLSLSDNIQETFGLSPVEAMAAGLPVVVSDWDGYRDTVRDGIDGFRIPTRLPPAPNALSIAERYLQQGNFRHYYGTVAMNTAVDLDACAAALARLIRDPDLRRRMGESGRRRTRETYDWRVVMKSYHRLWQGLAEVRAKAEKVAPLPRGQAPYPLCDDPFRVFKAHASETLGPDTRLHPGHPSGALRLDEFRAQTMTQLGGTWRVHREAAGDILARVHAQGVVTVGELLRDVDAPEARIYRTVAYMLKLDLLRIAPA